MYCSIFVHWLLAPGVKQCLVVAVIVKEALIMQILAL